MEASLKQDGPRYTLAVERRLAHPPETVWRALTEPELAREWFPCEIEGEWAVGSALRFDFLHGEGDGLSEEDLSGEVLVVDAPRLLEFRWGTHLLKYELEAEAGGCLFRLSESFDDASWGARNAAGWEMCLENLHLLVEGGALVKFAADVWRSKFERYVRKFEPDFGPQDGPPESHTLMTDEPEPA